MDNNDTYLESCHEAYREGSTEEREGIISRMKEDGFSKEADSLKEIYGS